MVIGSTILTIPSILGGDAILSGGQYISFMLGILGVYSTANVAERHVNTKSRRNMPIATDSAEARVADNFEAQRPTNKTAFLDSQDLRGFLLK